MALDTETGGKNPSGNQNQSSGPSEYKRSMIEWLRDSFKEARAKGNAANEKRYGQILTRYDELEDSQKKRWGDIDKRFDKLSGNLDDRSDTIGDQIAELADTAIKEVTR